ANARRKNRFSPLELSSGPALIIALAMPAMMVMAAQALIDRTMSLCDLAMINAYLIQLFFLFFSSSRRHTRSKRDWSSDVCSSDLQSFLIALFVTGSAKTKAFFTVYSAIVKFYR